MSKKILVITGSPRANGNSNTIATAFVSGAIAVGNEVKIFDAASARLGGCHGEQNCIKSGCCGLKDDTAKLNELMRWADVMVLVSPLYWKGFTSQIKAAIDVMYQYLFPMGKSQLAVKEAALIATGKSMDGFAFDCMVGEYRYIVSKLGLKDRFTLLCPGLDGLDAIKDHKIFIETAIQYGMKI